MRTEHNTLEREWFAPSGEFGASGGYAQDGGYAGRYAERERWDEAARERIQRVQRIRSVAAWAGGVARSRSLWGCVVVMLASALLAFIYHLNRPQPFIPFHDTLEYVRRADTMLSGGAWVDPIRLPGYPLLLALVFAFAGKSNYVAAEVTQSALFVATSGAVYALAYRVSRHVRLASLAGLLFAVNLYFFSYFRAILSDGLGALLVVGLALSVVLFIERPSAPRFWAVAALCFAALITRGEWVLAPVALFPFLLVVAYRRGMARRLIAPVGAALLLIYGAVVGYMALNWRVNGYFGLTDATNINLYGKITQYGMQRQAPGQFASMASATEAFTRRGIIDPWTIYWRDNALAGRHFSQMGAFAQSIILRHPIEFLAHSAPVGFTSLYDAYVFGGYDHTGALAGLLAAAQAFSMLVYPLFMLFPLCAVIWLVVALRRRGGSDGKSGGVRSGQALVRAEALAALSLLALYALAVTTLTTYSEYGRLHIAFDPLMLIVVIVSFAALLGALPRRLIQRAADA